MSENRRPEPLTADQLRWRLPAAELHVDSTEELVPCDEIIGQERALKAIRLGLAVDRPGYNIFVTGLSGTGRTTTIKCLLEEMDLSGQTPDDLLYLHNFHNPDAPCAVTLPQGHGRRFRDAMSEVIETLKSAIPNVFESEEYQRRSKELLERYREQERQLTRGLERQVDTDNFRLVQLQMGPITRTDILPVIDDKPVSLEELEARVERDEFPRQRFETLRERHHELSSQLEETLKSVRKLQRELKSKARELDNTMIRPVVEQVVNELKQEFNSERIHKHLDDVAASIRDNPYEFRPDGEGGPQQPQERSPDPLGIYRVNLVVDNSETQGAPVLIETSPSYKNVFGTIERVMDRSGAVRPSFHDIKAGSFLRASGGYLILNAYDVLTEPFVWPPLKRTLRSGTVEVQSYDPYLLFSTSGLKPEPFQARTKVILIGDRWMYQLLWALDPDFKKIFKIRADFDTRMALTDGAPVDRYLGVVGKLIKDEQLLAFDRGAIAALLEHSSRASGRKERLSTEFNALVDVLREADFIARERGGKQVREADVQQVVTERRLRLGLIEDKLLELIDDGVILIDTSGAKTGQVNGLAVYDLGDFRFGKPTRITARTGLGRAGIVNIEREADLSGKSHNKGVLILGGFLQGRFGRRRPLTLSASLAFEQSYEGVDGDSASSTELYALLSSLSELPLRQDIAVTGSINQHGEIQAIGGVNEKIEGFFDVCRLQGGLSGEQGVIIPRANVVHLMLRPDVVEAVREGRFRVWAIDHVDQGIELLTGRPAGVWDEQSGWSEGSVNRLVDERLSEMLETMRGLAAQGLAEALPEATPKQDGAKG